MDKQLQNKLKMYSALATGAVLAGNYANAAVVYTSVNQVFGPGDNYDLDLDNGGTIDFSFSNNSAYYSGYGIAALYLMNPNLNGIVGSLGTYGGYNFLYPNNLPSGSYVGSAYWTFINSYSVASLNWFGYYGNFIGVTDGFIGLQFDLAGSTHYGWVRISCDASGANWEIIDYAYESTPDTPIVTGDTGAVGVKEKSDKVKGLSIFADAAAITVTTDNSFENSELYLVNMQGQILHTSSISSGTTNIPNTFAKGLYFVKIIDAKGKAITRKVML